MQLQNKKINFLGDSITEGGNATCAENVYVQVVTRLANLSQARNYGVGGTCIAKRRTPFSEAELNEFWSEDFVARAMKMNRDADAVVVFGGTNDYGHGDVPIGNVYDSGDT
ncbi:MAG: SGNH/GDSL hydrolase family protein, partial [Candidatus Fimimonas sp.]